jgi:alpha-tubulin suppressor-like RCC1 family protein
MPVFYNYTEGGRVYSFDDVFVPADAFREGNLWGWGLNSFGNLGVNDTNTRCTPVTTSTGGANWKQVSGGKNHTAAIKTDGTLWTWGYNISGQIGDLSTTNRLVPVTTFAGGTNWKQVSCGESHTAAIKTDGTLWTWGNNTNGQIGDNTTINNRITPVTTFTGGTNWKQVDCGGYFTAAIKTDGTLWTWGNNAYGKLGINNTTQQATPVQVFGSATNWKQVACGVNHIAAIKIDGTLWIWGRNNNSQLGVNDTTQRITPVTTFAGGTNWKQVSCGGVGAGGHTAAIKTDGTLWTWGRNTEGALGNNTFSVGSSPVTTFAGGTNWKQVDCGGAFTSAIKTNGTLWTWGNNTNAQLGLNDITTRATPAQISTGTTNWKLVSSGGYHTTATTYIDSYQ